MVITREMAVRRHTKNPMTNPTLGGTITMIIEGFGVRGTMEQDHRREMRVTAMIERRPQP